MCVNNSALICFKDKALYKYCILLLYINIREQYSVLRLYDGMIILWCDYMIVWLYDGMVIRWYGYTIF